MKVVVIGRRDWRSMAVWGAFNYRARPNDPSSLTMECNASYRHECCGLRAWDVLDCASAADQA